MPPTCIDRLSRAFLNAKWHLGPLTILLEALDARTLGIDMDVVCKAEVQNQTLGRCAVLCITHTHTAHNLPSLNIEHRRSYF